MDIRRTIAAVTAAACILSLTACGENQESAGGTGTAGESTDPVTSTSRTESSSTEATEAKTTETSAEEDGQEPVEKIPLTGDEMSEIVIYGSTSSFLEQCQEQGITFDFTRSIDTVEQLNFIIGRLVKLIKSDEADAQETVPIDDGLFMEELYYFFEPETMEKLIQDYFLPSFKLDSVNYRRSGYWDAENRYFRVFVAPDFYNTVDRFCVVENAYLAGDYYYADAVIYYTPPTNFVKLSLVAADYFDTPRIRLKLKRFSYQSEFDESYTIDQYIVVGFEPLKKRPEWLDAAKMLMNACSWNQEDYGSHLGAEYGVSTYYGQSSIGVMDGVLGKRMYIASWGDMGSRNHFSDSVCETFGIRGENDSVCYYEFSQQVIYADPENETMHSRDYSKIMIRDNLRGETYSYVSNDDGLSYTHNGIKISAAEFANADIVAYFNGYNGVLGISEEQLLYKCEHSLEELTLADLYEMSRIITE